MVIEKKYKVSVQDENVPGITAVKQAEELAKSYCTGIRCDKKTKQNQSHLGILFSARRSDIQDKLLPVKMIHINFLIR